MKTKSKKSNGGCKIKENENFNLT